MSGRIEELGLDNSFLRFVRVGEKLVRGSTPHRVLAMEILGISQSDEIPTMVLRRIALQEDPLADAGMLSRTYVEGASGPTMIYIAGESGILKIPEENIRRDKLDEIRQKTLVLFKKQFDEETFVIGRF